eukprot:TRINITY_DN20499_c0_g1_i1.p1 TRINITY_DN20499_c0_g1~~TRINITY_DN20499_c0_g1_i1.p1  ORF type:complete len:142 (-),score=35.21 TRINITY_DN20499_c0_g1_i1:10-435(-)
MMNCTPLLEYLGGEKYKDLCRIGEFYHKGTFINNTEIPLSSLNNRIIQKLFVSILKLIKFFQEKALVACPIQENCKNVTKALDGKNREDKLFLCLNIPSDDVRLAVVDVLDFVNVVDFSDCLLYTSPSPRDRQKSRMPSSA